MEKPEIKTKKDVGVLVETFYKKIKKDTVLGPIFNHVITDWEEHLKLLTNFWDAQLFLKRNYNGNPITAHQEVDKKMNHSISSEHFGLWLNLWFATIDELYSGETAWIAKNRAQKMSTMLFMSMYTNRTK